MLSPSGLTLSLVRHDLSHVLQARSLVDHHEVEKRERLEDG